MIHRNILIVSIVYVLLLISVMTSDWSVSDGIGINKLSFGLWKNCVDKSCGNIERIYNNNFPKSMLYVCRALAIISLLCLLVCVYLQYTNKLENVNLLIFISGLLMLLTCIIWAVEFRKITISGSNPIPSTSVTYTLGYSFYLILLSGLMCIALASYNKNKI